MAIMALNETAKNNIVKYLTDNEYCFTIVEERNDWIIKLQEERKEEPC